jgi:CheY-like chemotaxis protein
MSTILCIDDQPVGLGTRKLLLETKGYEVLIAPSGRDGFDLLASQDVAAVIVDYSMPEMNGEEVARAIRQRWPAVPIIILSGYPDIPQSTMDAADAFIVKGSSPTVLLTELERLIGQRPEIKVVSPAVDRSRELRTMTSQNVARSQRLRRRKSG